MVYFTGIKSFDDLKYRFRALAKIHHPDLGGDPEIMKDINAEYKPLFSYWFNRTPSSKLNSKIQQEFHTSNRWIGVNFQEPFNDLKRNTIFRRFLKKRFPDCRFSVRKKMGFWATWMTMFQMAVHLPCVHIHLKEAPFEVFKRPEELWRGDFTGLWPLTHDEARRIIQRGFVDLGRLEALEYELILTSQIQNVFAQIKDFVESYRCEDYDAHASRFNINFDYRLCIGQKNESFKFARTQPYSSSS